MNLVVSGWGDDLGDDWVGEDWGEDWGGLG